MSVGQSRFGFSTGKAQLVPVTKVQVNSPGDAEVSTSARSIASRSCQTSNNSTTPLCFSPQTQTSKSPTAIQTPMSPDAESSGDAGFVPSSKQNKHKKSVDHSKDAAHEGLKKGSSPAVAERPRRKSFTLKEGEVAKNGAPATPAAAKSPAKRAEPKQTGPNGVSLGEPICAKQREYFLLHGLDQVKKISRTLQGFVLEAVNVATDEAVIVKMTDRELHKQGITVKNGMKIRVKENIIKETRLMSFLAQHGPPAEFTNILDFFSDKSHYYLVMEHGGSDLFHWVVLNHERIRKRTLAKRAWQEHVQTLFAQMVHFVLFLDSLHCCHLDISLENLLVRHATYDAQTQSLDNEAVQVKFIDFGLAELFPKDNFQCRKYVGKQHYKCPKIYAKAEVFDARLADVWSLCITLFMMLIGAPPFQKPVASDSTFNAIYHKGKMRDVLVAWKRLKYMPDPAFDLLSRVLVPEPRRLSIHQVAAHPYVRPALVRHRARLHRAALRVSGSLSPASSASAVTVKTASDCFKKERR